MGMWRLSLRKYRIGNGSKQFGMTAWFNSARIGFQIDFWTTEIMIMWEL